MSESIFREIHPDLQAEKGMGGGVCIWRKDRSEDYFFAGTVGEFLTDPKHQSGLWCIDGGWGGPPGPIIVRWHEQDCFWENGGFCGRKFNTEVSV